MEKHLNRLLGGFVVLLAIFCVIGMSFLVVTIFGPILWLALPVALVSYGVGLILEHYENKN